MANPTATADRVEETVEEEVCPPLLCPCCPVRADAEALWGHLTDEHPGAAVRLSAAVEAASSKGREPDDWDWLDGLDDRPRKAGAIVEARGY